MVGKKNWLFFGSQRGGQIGASVFSLVATCKALGINPEVYLVLVAEQKRGDLAV